MFLLDEAIKLIRGGDGNEQSHSGELYDTDSEGETSITASAGRKRTAPPTITATSAGRKRTAPPTITATSAEGKQSSTTATPAG